MEVQLSPPNTTQGEVHALEEIDHSNDLSIGPSRLEQFKQGTAADPVMQDLIPTIKTG